MTQAEISHSLVKALRAVPVFAGLGDRDLLHIVGASANLHYSAGSVVFEAGSPSEALYIVLSGRIEIFTLVNGRSRGVASIGPGDFFGEVSLLRDSAHSKSARAVEDSELMVIPTESFRELLRVDRGLADRVAEKMAQRNAAQ